MRRAYRNQWLLPIDLEEREDGPAVVADGLPGGGGGKCHLEMGFRMANVAPDVLFLLNVETHPTLTLSPPPQKSMQDSQDGRCKLKVVPLES